MDYYTYKAKNGFIITDIPIAIKDSDPRLKEFVRQQMDKGLSTGSFAASLGLTPDPTGAAASPQPTPAPSPAYGDAGAMARLGGAAPMPSPVQAPAEPRMEDILEPGMPLPVQGAEGMKRLEGAMGAAVRGAGPVALGTGAGFLMGGPPGALAGAGSMALTQFVGDPLVGLVNKLMGTKLTRPTEALKQLFDTIGIPEPDTAVERVMQVASSGAGAAAATAALFKTLASAAKPLSQSVTKAILDAMASGIPQQIAGGAGGAGAAQAAAEMDAPLPVQIAAGLGGGMLASRMVPGSANLRTPAAKTAEDLSDDVGRLVKKASSIGPGRAAAREKLVKIAQVNPEAKAAAERLGFELPPDVFIDNPQVRSATGLARSAAGSEMEKVWRESVQNALDKADDIIRQYDAVFVEGSPAPAVVSSRVKDSLTRTREALSKQAADLYAEVDKAIPKETPIKLDKLTALLDDIIREVGADGLSAQEKRLVALTKTAGQPSGVTYGRLLREKNLIGQAIARKESPYGNMEAGTLKRLYGALAEDQLANVDAAGGYGAYHGATQPFSTSDMRTPAFFTSDPAVAKGFAERRALHAGEDSPIPRLLSGRITFKNPKVIDAGGDFAGNLQFGPKAAEYRAALSDAAHDGIIIRNTKDEGTLYVVKSMGQVKEILADAAEAQTKSLGEKLRTANTIYSKERELGDRIVEAFGSDLEGSIASTMKTAIVSASKGDGAKFARMLENVPADLQKETVATSLASVARNRRGEFGFAEFAQTYKGLRANPEVYAKIVKTLGPESDGVLRDLYEVSKRITDARAYVLTTGKANQALLQSMTAESLLGKIMGATVVRTGTTTAGAALAGPFGAGVGSVIADSLTHGKKDALRAAGKMFTSAKFQNLITKAAAGRPVSANDVKALARDSAFHTFAKAAKLPIATDQQEKWLFGALMSGAFKPGGIQGEEK